MRKLISTFVFISLLFFISAAIAQDKSELDSLKNVSLSGLSFRSIGPAITGGRVIGIAVNPFNHSEYYIASGNGGLWKTENNGITFKSVFESLIIVPPVNPVSLNLPLPGIF